MLSNQIWKKLDRSKNIIVSYGGRGITCYTHVLLNLMKLPLLTLTCLPHLFDKINVLFRAVERSITGATFEHGTKRDTYHTCLTKLGRPSRFLIRRWKLQWLWLGRAQTLLLLTQNGGEGLDSFREMLNECWVMPTYGNSLAKLFKSFSMLSGQETELSFIRA